MSFAEGGGGHIVDDADSVSVGITLSRVQDMS